MKRVLGTLLGAVLATVLVLGMAGEAMAYVGPGAGITMLGALWGVIVAIVLALAAMLYWPIRAVLRRRKATAAVAQDSGGTGAEPK